MNLSRFAALSFVLLLASVACRSALEPSPDYAAAQALVTAALSEQEESGYLDTRVDQALELLKKVPSGSLDADAARQLTERIGRERTALQTAAAERARAEAEAFADAPPEPALDETVDFAYPAAEPVAELPSAGTRLAALRDRYGDCLMAEEPFVEQGTGRRGEAWGLTPGQACAGRFPELKRQLVFVTAGEVVQVRAREGLTRMPIDPPSAADSAASAHNNGYEVRQEDGVPPLSASSVDDRAPR